MRGRPRRERKSRAKKSNLVGLVIVGSFITLVIFLIIPSGTTRPGDHKLRAALIDQLGFTYPNPEFVESASEMMRQAEFEVDVYRPETVKVSLYGVLPQRGYQLVIFRVHSGIHREMPGGPVGLFTTEPYSQSKYLAEQLRDLVAPARIYSNSSDAVFGISPRFILERSIVKQDFDHTIIILMGCYGLFNEELPKSFIDRRASVVIGWTGLVDVKHTDRATLTLLRMMLVEGADVYRSVRTVMNTVGPDPTYGSTLDYYPTQNGAVTISRIRGMQSMMEANCIRIGNTWNTVTRKYLTKGRGQSGLSNRMCPK